MEKAFIGIDVGTGSARAGIFDPEGRLVASAKHPIRLWQDAGGVAEQSSDDIWMAVCTATRQALAASGLPAQQIAGIGIDATCSLVVLDDRFQPVTVSASGEAARNIIVWMDHRATAEAKEINQSGARVLDYVGGSISPEMQSPKLLWLKRHLPESFAKAAHFFDLSDYLTARATGSLARSTCTVTCKWTYLAHEKRWDGDFFRAIGLPEFPGEGYTRIGTEILDPGTPLGRGLTAEAAADLGLVPGIAVGAALIDAHAGGVGTVGAIGPNGEAPDPLARVAYIMGTSACIMASTESPLFVKGIWGPYQSAMIPGLWLNEGGQSAAGAAIDYLLRLHPAFPDLETRAKADALAPLEWLEKAILARGPASDAVLATQNLHIVPDLLGNRSPFADPDARGVILGLDMEPGIDGLIRLYLAALCGLGYSTAQVIDAFRTAGQACTTLVMSGGASRSPLVRQIMADTTGCTVAYPTTAEPVLLGAAMLGALAAGRFTNLPQAMAAMSRIGSLTQPAAGGLAAFHTKKRQIFTLMQTLDREARSMMAE
ncbi:FGGY-family carbohydrate kinase [Elstera cyanobacteriorum]|uniref:FGGY-family carbohydrate kinase n=1 Tax=Elstera cyanobacteriorum TaxID=2022747 RepID=UPI0023579222|nr:FGGY-family carbohydrate kinase [Elstera cyanobacteriorum]MCK6442574.1 FGGY-family carbohydrate kinase [Elstera cyanobacteriorum]